jgi:triosephosphate isomerase (TIM)
VERPAADPAAATNTTDGGRRYLIAANWKCNGTIAETMERIQFLNAAAAVPNVDVVICAPYVHLPILLTKLRSDLHVGAQTVNVYTQDGAYTGEVSANMIVDLGCTWTIVGHSERRAGVSSNHLPQSEEFVAQKAKTALDAGLKIMFCVGEMKEDREAGTTMTVIEKQLEPLTKILKEEDWAQVAIAYEPVWAIGTGLTATPEMAQETHASIRQWISSHVSPAVAAAVRIQYGGSMKGSNAADLLAQPDIDGGLVGGASLTPDFLNIIRAVN